MKRELLNIEGGKIKKGNNVIFDDLSLELFQGEITGIVFDDILEQKLFIDMLLGDVLLYSGKIFVNEERKAYEEAARLLKQQVAVIGSKSKLLPSITIEDNIFLFSEVAFILIFASVVNSLGISQILTDFICNSGISACYFTG